MATTGNGRPAERGHDIDGDDGDDRVERGDTSTHHDSHSDHTRAHRTDGGPVDRKEAVAREREAYGGMKIGSAFFGFLTATGVSVLLVALITAVGVTIGLSTGATTADEAANATGATTVQAGAAGAIVLLVVLFIAYFCGGYVAGRMARFDGARQGFAVWLWAVLIGIVTAVLIIVAGNRFDVLSQVNGLPQIPVNDVTTGGLVAAVLVLLVTLAGAVLGGFAGMRFHRKVDRAGWRPSEHVRS